MHVEERCNHSDTNKHKTKISSNVVEWTRREYKEISDSEKYLEYIRRINILICI